MHANGSARLSTEFRANRFHFHSPVPLSPWTLDPHPRHPLLEGTSISIRVSCPVLSYLVILSTARVDLAHPWSQFIWMLMLYKLAITYLGL